MATRVVKFKCEGCQEEGDIQVFDSINVTVNPELKEAVLNKAIFVHQCPKCGQVYQVLSPLVYHDMDKKYIFYFTHPDNISQAIESVNTVSKKNMEGYRYRIMIDYNELVEKIMILDANLDDNIMELTKLKFLATHENEGIDKVYFFDNGKEKRFDAMKGSEYYGSTPFPSQLYKEVYNEEIGEISRREIFVSNRQWAINYLIDKKRNTKSLYGSKLQ